MLRFALLGLFGLAAARRNAKLDAILSASKDLDTKEVEDKVDVGAQAGVFHVSGFELTGSTDASHLGSLSLKVSKTSQVGILTQAQQHRGSFPVHQNSPLRAAGVTSWRSTAKGIMLSKDNVTPFAHCVAANSKDLGDQAFQLGFSCHPADADSAAQSMRFATDKTETDDDWGAADSYAMGYGGLGGYWQNALGGCPYGQSGIWPPSWNYDYYSVTPWGYYGCGYLDAGYCSSSPSYLSWADLDWSVGAV